MAGLSAPQTAREETIRITWALIATLLFAIGASLLCFLYLDRPREPASPRPAPWLSAPQSSERVFRSTP